MACTATAVRQAIGCPELSNVCDVTQEIVCDGTCGAECVYDFSKTLPTYVFLSGDGRFRSTGPTMRFSYFLDMGPVSSRPAIETVEGGTLIFQDQFRMLRPIRAPGGLIEAEIVMAEPFFDTGYRTTALDVSSRIAGGTIHVKQYFIHVSMLARGYGKAPGGSVIINGGSTLNFDPPSPPRPGRGVHRIDVSGATGGTVQAKELGRLGDILARGKRGPGGTVVLDSTGAPDDFSGNIMLGECLDYEQWADGRSYPGVIDVSGSTTGGTFIARTDPAAIHNSVWICQKIRASGKYGGGTVEIRNGAEFREIDVRGSSRGPGGAVHAISGIGYGLEGASVDVSGNPAGDVVIDSEKTAGARAILADGMGDGAAAGRVLLRSTIDPPSAGASGARFISATSVNGLGGQVTLQNCFVPYGYIYDSTIQVSGQNALILLQGRDAVNLSSLQTSATGPGAKVRVEYGQTFVPNATSPFPDELFQYPNPACDCTKTLAECMTPP